MTPSQTAHPTEGELLPCPFCGSRGYLTVNKPSGQEEVKCRNSECVARGPLARSNESAIAAWNTRPVVRPQGEEGLRAMDHAANEWADAFYNAVQWIRNIKNGVSLPDTAIQNVERCAEHCQATWAAAKAISNQGKPSS